MSKWRRKGQEIGITEQGRLSSMEIQLLPQNTQMIKTEVVSPVDRIPKHFNIFRRRRVALRIALVVASAWRRDLFLVLVQGNLLPTQ